jgi:hypothetical protein
VSDSKTIKSIEWFLKEARKVTDRFLQDYSAAWGHPSAERGGVEDVIPQTLHNESVALARRAEKDAGSVSVNGIYLSMDSKKNLTIATSGSHYVWINAADVQAFLDALNGLTAGVPEPVQDDASQAGLENLPLTNQQLSLRQNDLVAQYLKNRR